jgi:hypothetical protein
MPDLPPRARVPLLVLGVAALAAGVLAGLARLGVSAPGASLAAWHGPLMVAAFFGTVIALERAVAARALWAYAAPLLCGVGGIALWVGDPLAAGTFAAAGAGVLAIVTLRFLVRTPEIHLAALAAGAAALAAGDIAWLVTGVPSSAVPAWIAFFVLTIAGERLELTRFLPRSAFAQRAFVALALATAAGAAAAGHPAGARALGVALVLFAAWLAHYDLARRTVRDRGLSRYTAVCLLSGYAWLAIAGATIAGAGLAPGTAAYDAALHALFVGFVFAMVFGHAPIIVPAVLRVALPYSPAFYVPLALLHASLVLRVAGDAAQAAPALAAGGIANAIAIAVFIATALVAVVRGRRA